MSRNLKLSFVFSFLGILAGISIIPAQIEMASLLYHEEIDLPYPLPVVLLIGGIQFGIITFVLSLAGITLAQKVNLRSPLLTGRINLSTKGIVISIAGSLIGMLTVLILEKLIFIPMIPELSQMDSLTWWKGLLAGVIYGGIFEEIAVRLFLMTLIVWLLAKLTNKHRENIPQSHYWMAIIVSSLLFGLGHLAMTNTVFGYLSPMIVTRALVTNGILGLFFGYLYWKKGIEYAMLSHMTAHLLLYGVVVPLFG